MRTDGEDLEAVRAEATAALAAWDLAPDDWTLVGTLQGSLGSVLRPVIEIHGQRYVLRRQPSDLRERDIQFRHEFGAHLAGEGLPVPALRPRPGGATYALVAGEFYELQTWRDGAPYQPQCETAVTQVAAAAAALGMLHQASALFAGSPLIWPEERSTSALARAYVAALARTAERDDVTPPVAAALGRLAEVASERVAVAAGALAVTPGPPELHIHGDYQPWNLAFDDGVVTAIYDLDAVRWARRLDELAYAMLGFTALHDEPASVPVPLAGDGLDTSLTHAFLRAYGQVAPPAEDEAALLGDALALAFPVLLVNGLLEDIVFADDFVNAPAEADVLARLEWAEPFWIWLDRYRGVLAESWQSAER
jgi:Ser/Thr protein kinase RdoA (MazF antagonist)